MSQTKLPPKRGLVTDLNQLLDNTRTLFNTMPGLRASFVDAEMNFARKKDAHENLTQQVIYDVRGHLTTEDAYDQMTGKDISEDVIKLRVQSDERWLKSYEEVSAAYQNYLRADQTLKNLTDSIDLLKAQMRALSVLIEAGVDGD